MALTQKTFLLCALIVALTILEFVSSAFGIRLLLRLPLFTAIAVVVFILMRRIQVMLTQVRAVTAAIEDTAHGNLHSDMPVESNGEIGMLANSVRTMRVRIGEMGNQMYESVRIESLNILGSILVHDMKNLSSRLSLRRSLWSVMVVNPNRAAEVPTRNATRRSFFCALKDQKVRLS